MAGKGCVGISIADEGVGCAHIDWSSGKPELLACEYRLCASQQNVDFELEHIIDELKLADSPCVIALTPQKYQLFLVDALSFGDDNKRAVLAEELGDTLEYNIDDAMLEYLPLPPSPTDGKQMGYIISAKQADIDAQVASAENAGLNVRAVDVATCAIRNIAINIPGAEAGIFYLNLMPNASQIMLLRNGYIEMARYFDVDLKILISEPGEKDEAATVTAEEDALVEAIGSEIEKSMKYAESVLGQAAVSNLLLAPMNKKILNIMPKLEKRVGLSTRSTDLSECVGASDSMIPEHQQRCLFAVGAALRDLRTPESKEEE